MRSFFFFLLVLSQIFTFGQSNIEIKDSFFFIDGQKVFLKGIGYSTGTQPGQLPWTAPFDSVQMHLDLKRIQDAGYNMIRTWGALTEEELNIVEQYELVVIMGIWIDPEGDFDDPFFIQNAKNTVQNVLNYSKNYDQVIAYLIMNEPLDQHIFDVGYVEFLDLLEDCIEIVHQAHPGRPVSISNSVNGTYIDPTLFDFQGFNVYPYNPVTVNHLLEYQYYVNGLLQHAPSGQALIMTEFGLSVSPNGSGNWGYGGNTLEEQKNGDLYMYRALVNGGASGACIFQYSDGWWKAGDEFVHDPHPEEWFGLIGYHHLNDMLGYKRPAWDAIRKFQSLIITEPKVGGVYVKEIPLEFFPNDTIDRIEVWANQQLLYQTLNPGQHVMDTIELTVNQVNDVELFFLGYNQANQLVKQEVKVVLISPEELDLPTVEMEIDPDQWGQQILDVDYTFRNHEPFAMDSTLNYAYYPHKGWGYGIAHYKEAVVDSVYELPYVRGIASDVNVVTAGASVWIRYGNFERLIFTQQTHKVTDTIPTPAMDTIVSTSNSAQVFMDPIKIFPNPAENIISVDHESDGLVYQITDLNGKYIQDGRINDTSGIIEVGLLQQGLYIIQFQDKSKGQQWIGKFVKHASK